MLPVLVVGDINLDLSFQPPSLPAPGHDAQSSTLVLGAGGTGLNAAVAFAGLGAKPMLLARVGPDPFAELLQATASKRGLDLSLLQVDDTAVTGTCVVISTPDGERTFVSHRGANAELDASCLTAAPWDALRLLYVSAYTLMQSPQRDTVLSLIEKAKTAKIPIALDMGLPPADACRDIILHLVPCLDLIALNEDECCTLMRKPSAEAGLQAVVEAGARRVALKRGGRGCTVWFNHGRVDVPAKVVEVCDTTACGDAFSATFAWGLVQGWSSRRCARIANLIGGSTAMCRGAAESIPDATKVESILRSELEFSDDS